MPSNYTLVSHMEDLNHAKISLYQVHGNEKFFRENEMDNHLDKKYSKDIGYVDRNTTIETLYFLFDQFLDWLQNDESISNLKTAYLDPDIMPNEYLFQFDIKPDNPLIYFLDYGSLLGSYRNQSIIPWDVNGDIGILHKDLQQLPLEYETNKWIFKQNPMFYEAPDMNIYDSHNTVPARVISKKNGIFINIWAYSLIHKTEFDCYLYSTNDFLRHEKWHKATDLFPINKTGGILKDINNIPIPKNTRKWLLSYYDNLGVPEDHKNDGDFDADYDYQSYGWGGWGYGDGEQIKDLKEQLKQQKEEIEKLKELILADKKDKL